jgi:hypothetical protein
MPRRTYQAHRARLIQQRGAPRRALDHSEPVQDLAESLYRESLEVANRELARLKSRQVKNGGLGAKDVAALGRLCRELDDIARRTRARAAKASSPNAAHRASAAAPSRTRSVVSRILQSPEPVPDDPRPETENVEGGGDNARSLLASIAG